jgi:hypothetical protein
MAPKSRLDLRQAQEEAPASTFASASRRTQAPSYRFSASSKRRIAEGASATKASLSFIAAARKGIRWDESQIIEPTESPKWRTPVYGYYYFSRLTTQYSTCTLLSLVTPLSLSSLLEQGTVPFAIRDIWTSVLTRLFSLSKAGGFKTLPSTSCVVR